MSDQRSPGLSARDPAATPAAAPHAETSTAFPEAAPAARESPERPREYGGRKGLDPVRYGDWEKNGRCIDF